MATKIEYELGIKRDGKTDVGEILDRIYDSLREGRSILVDIVTFEERIQKPGESFSDFLSDLKTLAKRAQLCSDCRDVRLVGRIVTGLHDPDTRQMILERKLLTLVDVEQFCRDREYAKNNQKKITKQPIPPSANAVSNTTKSTKSTKPSKDGKGNDKPRARSSSRGRKNQEKERCKTCGRKPHKEGNRCPALDRECASCKKKGHFAAVCRSKNDDATGST